MKYNRALCRIDRDIESMTLSQSCPRYAVSVRCTKKCCLGLQIYFEIL